MLQKTGSVKNKVVSPDLLAERAKCNFDQEELRVHLMGGPLAFAGLKKSFERFGNDP